MEEVKIIYCYDENHNPIHYTKTNKNQKYFCIDCGQELICKDGNIKIKHLAHKNITKCRGSGESVIHKHWKENLCKAGMNLKIKEKQIEILETHNEVSLNKRYKKDWDREIIVDTLLETEDGDVVIEVNYKNAKDWIYLIPYYDQLNLLSVFEVTVNDGVNNIIWTNLESIKEEIFIREQKVKEIEKRKQQKEMMSPVNNFKVFLNFKTRPKVHNYPIYYMFCAVENNEKQYVIQKLKFNIANLGWLKCDLDEHTKVEKGIKYCYVKAKGIINDELLPLEVIDISNLYDAGYNQYLYKLLCSAVST